MPIKLANNASGTLATAISASDTGIVLTTGDGAEFPTLGAGDYFYATITSTQGTQEIVKATARSGDSLTVVRAQEGTSAAGFAAGARFELRVTAASVDDLVEEVRTELAASSGSSLVGFLQAGTNAVPTTVQAKLRETVSVFDFMSAAEIADVQTGTGSIQLKTLIDKAIDAAEGKILYFPEGTYLASPLFLKSNITVVLDPGVRIKQAAGTTSIFWLQDITDTHIEANGATLEGSATGAYHVVTFAGAKRCSIRGANITGAGTNMDGVYVGVGATSNPCEDVVILGGSVANAKRNGISVVGGFRTIVDGVEIYGTTGSPGAGIDVEANNYGVNADALIQNCVCRNNQRSGIINSFGYRTTLRRNLCYANGDHGIVATTGGVTFNTGVYRSNVDVRGVSAFDTATGRVSVGGDLESLPVGSLVLFQTRNGATLPGGLALSVYTVCAHVSGSTTDIKVGLVLESQVINSFSSPSTGVLNSDPVISDITLVCYGVPGQTSELTIEQNVCHTNGLSGIRATTSRNIKVLDNLCYENTREQIYCDFIYGLAVENNRVYQETQTNRAGIYVAYGAFSKINGNSISEVGGAGLNVATSSYAIIQNNFAYNCGRLAAGIYDALYVLESMTRVRAQNNTGYSSEDYAGTYGMQTSLVTNSQFVGNFLKNAGNSNANSFVLSGATNYTQRNIQYDGTTWGTFTATYDPPSLNDGDGVTTNVTVTNAALGDFVRVSFSLALQGIMLTAWVTSSTNVAVRFQNETGGVIDLGSGTLRVTLEKP